MLAAGHRGFSTIPHFDGCAAVLIQLDMAGKLAVREAIVDGWLSVAPPALAQSFLARRPGRGRIVTPTG